MDIKAAAGESFRRAFFQYTQGCTRQFCLNPQCAKSGKTVEKNPTKAAALLLELFTNNPKNFMYCPDEELQRTKHFENFLDLNCLSHSFVSNDSTKARVDFPAVADAYSVLNEMIDEGELRKNWLGEALTLFEVNPYSSMYLPRVSLILLVNPSLIDPEYYGGLQILVKKLSQVPEVYSELSLAIDSVPSDLIRQIVQALQQYLTIKLCEISSTSGFDEIEGTIKLLDCFQSSNKRVPRITASEFYNDAANKELNLKNQFRYWKENLAWHKRRFTLIDFAWILDASSKSKLLAMESLVQMHTELIESFRMSQYLGENSVPYFILEVRRENLLEDTLAALVSGDNNLKMQLRVHFVGEDGVDEGGVKKEFFQLIVKELLDPIYSMFNYYPESRLYWFNPHTLESNINFELIGIIFGLAIYNGVILDVHFPAAIYKKLLKQPTSIDDLEQVNPELVRGFKQLLEFQGDVEGTFCRTFEAETMAFDEVVKHELKEAGSEIPVTEANRAEFVELYVDWFINGSIAHLFESFYRGFWRVCGGDVLQLFTPEELELTICGNPVLNFYELERTTSYESGYSASTPIIVAFWELVHSFTLEQKKKLLSFVTGSDRAPIDGLASLHLKIARNGPDSDRLMTAHTCFNYLLLPEYSSKEKLGRMLNLAINNSEGFGLR